MKEDKEELERKQSYLREQILDQNYNVENFNEYISNLKENGNNLMNWTMNELVEIVNNFKKKESNSKKDAQDNSKNVDKEKSDTDEDKSSSDIENEEKEEKEFGDMNNIELNLENNFFNLPKAIFESFKKIDNIYSDLKLDDEKEYNDFLIMQDEDFVDTSPDIIKCIKQTKNALSNHKNLNVEVSK